MTNISSNKTIAKNSLCMFLRMIVVTIVSLFTARVNLQVLGVIDTGIYQIVGCVVIALSFLNSSLSGATTRFLSNSIGIGNKKDISDTFSTSFFIHCLVAILIFILCETIGLWYINNKISVPIQRIDAAKIVYQISIIASIFNITQIPFSALLLSFEKFKAYSYICIIESTLKLIVSLLLFISPFDKLLSYSFLILLVIIIVQVIYCVYCFHSFNESHIKITYNIEIFRKILSFTCWDLLGNFSVMIRVQGVNLLLNLFFGPSVNAACSFANTIAMTFLNFANNFLSAVRTPLLKSFAILDYKKVYELMVLGGKYSYILLLPLTLVFTLKSNYVLKLWLEIPPKHTNIFAILELVTVQLSLLFVPLVYCIHASGKIRYMSTVSGIIWTSTLPISYLFLKEYCEPTVPFIVKNILFIFVILSNLYYVTKILPNFCIIKYIKETLLPVIPLSVLSFLLLFMYLFFIDNNSFVSFIIMCILSEVIVNLLSYFFVLSKKHKEILKEKIKNKLRGVL